MYNIVQQLISSLFLSTVLTKLQNFDLHNIVMKKDKNFKTWNTTI